MAKKLDISKLINSEELLNAIEANKEEVAIANVVVTEIRNEGRRLRSLARDLGIISRKKNSKKDK